MVEYNFDEFIQKLEELQANVQEAGKRVTARAIQEGKREAKDKTPTGKYTDKVFFMTRAGEQVHFTTGYKKQGGTLKKGWETTRPGVPGAPAADKAHPTAAPGGVCADNKHPQGKAAGRGT